MDEFLTVGQVAEILRHCPKTIKRWRAAGKIVGVRPGRRWLFARSEVERLLKVAE